MKTNRFYGLLVATILFALTASCNGGKKQSEQETVPSDAVESKAGFTPSEEVLHVITLLVDTEDITDENFLTKCRFVGQTQESAKDFVYPYLEGQIVNVGENIVWNAQDYNGNEIKVLNIKYVSGHRPFANDELPGNAQGRVRSSPNSNTKGKEPMKYSIKFQVQGTGEPYVIDPILKVGQPK